MKRSDRKRQRRLRESLTLADHNDLEVATLERSAARMQRFWDALAPSILAAAQHEVALRGHSLTDCAIDDAGFFK
jgi:hypothetical protein